MKKKRTLREWVEVYNKHTPEPFKRDERYNLYFLPDKGFCEIGMTGDMVFIHQLCGDGRYWFKAVTNLAQKIRASRCGTICIRPEIRAYIRLFGFKIAREEDLGDGMKRYYCKNKETGKEGLISPCFQYKDSGVQAYFVTWNP